MSSDWLEQKSSGDWLQQGREPARDWAPEYMDIR